MVGSRPKDKETEAPRGPVTRCQVAQPGFGHLDPAPVSCPRPGPPAHVCLLQEAFRGLSPLACLLGVDLSYGLSF